MDLFQFFLLSGSRLLSWSDHFYILAGNTAGNGDSEKHMIVVLAITLSSENSSPSCQFLDGCYCTNINPDDATDNDNDDVNEHDMT